MFFYCKVHTAAAIIKQNTKSSAVARCVINLILKDKTIINSASWDSSASVPMSIWEEWGCDVSGCIISHTSLSTSLLEPSGTMFTPALPPQLGQFEIPDHRLLWNTNIDFRHFTDFSIIVGNERRLINDTPQNNRLSGQMMRVRNQLLSSPCSLGSPKKSIHLPTYPQCLVLQQASIQARPRCDSGLKEHWSSVWGPVSQRLPLLLSSQTLHRTVWTFWWPAQAQHFFLHS